MTRLVLWLCLLKTICTQALPLILPSPEQRAAGRLDVAVFGFESVLFWLPEYHEARYYLAMTYLEQSNLFAAEQALQTLQIQRLPVKLADRAKAASAALAEADPF